MELCSGEQCSPVCGNEPPERKPRPLSLTPRLLTVVSFIRPNDRVLDIGTDHARLPVYLMERGLCASVTATDVCEGPLARAARTIKGHKLEGKIPLLLCNGGVGLDPLAYDTVTICGMGSIKTSDSKSLTVWRTFVGQQR